MWQTSSNVSCKILLICTQEPSRVGLSEEEEEGRSKSRIEANKRWEWAVKRLKYWQWQQGYRRANGRVEHHVCNGLMGVVAAEHDTYCMCAIGCVCVCVCVCAWQQIGKFCVKIYFNWKCPPRAVNTSSMDAPWLCALGISQLTSFNEACQVFPVHEKIESSTKTETVSDRMRKIEWESAILSGIQAMLLLGRQETVKHFPVLRTNFVMCCHKIYIRISALPVTILFAQPSLPSPPLLITASFLAHGHI